MTRTEWLELEKEWSRKAAKAYEKGDVAWGVACEKKADACRASASLAQDR